MRLDEAVGVLHEAVEAFAKVWMTMHVTRSEQWPLAVERREWLTQMATYLRTIAEDLEDAAEDLEDAADEPEVKPMRYAPLFLNVVLPPGLES